MSGWEWFFDWAQTPGFAGVFAVVAAVIAYLAGRHSARASRANMQREQWWNRAEYALNLTMTGDPDMQLIGLQMLQSLLDESDSKEEEFIRVVTDSLLNPVGDGTSTDDAAPESDVSTSGPEPGILGQEEAGP